MSKDKRAEIVEVMADALAKRLYKDGLKKLHRGIADSYRKDAEAALDIALKAAAKMISAESTEKWSALSGDDEQEGENDWEAGFASGLDEAEAIILVLTSEGSKP